MKILNPLAMPPIVQPLGELPIPIDPPWDGNVPPPHTGDPGAILPPDCPGGHNR